MQPALDGEALDGCTMAVWLLAGLHVCTTTYLPVRMDPDRPMASPVPLLLGLP